MNSFKLIFTQLWLSAYFCVKLAFNLTKQQCRDRTHKKDDVTSAVSLVTEHIRLKITWAKLQFEQI